MIIEIKMMRRKNKWSKIKNNITESAAGKTGVEWNRNKKKNKKSWSSAVSWKLALCYLYMYALR